MNPTAIIVAGPNGAGKTTLARELILSHLPDDFNFLNADLIAEGLSPFKPQSAAIEAGKNFLHRFERKVSQKESFLVESTFSGKSFTKRLIDLKQAGYRLEIIYLWLPDADFAVQRVERRVRLGGHDVPEQTIRRRFTRSMIHFFKLYQDKADSVTLLDGSRQPPTKIAHWVSGELTQAADKITYKKIIQFIDEALIQESKAAYHKPRLEGYVKPCLDQLLEGVGRFLTNLELETKIPLVIRKED